MEAGLLPGFVAEPLFEEAVDPISPRGLYFPAFPQRLGEKDKVEDEPSLHNRRTTRENAAHQTASIA
jgi:hypothetical protein